MKVIDYIMTHPYWTSLGVITSVLLFILGYMLSGTPALVLEDISINQRLHGYVYTFQISNNADGIASIDEIQLNILKTKLHPIKNNKLMPEESLIPENLPDVYLSPQKKSLEITGPGRYTFPKDDIQTFSFKLFSNTDTPGRDYVYDIQLEARWHQPGSSSIQISKSGLYRLGFYGIQQQNVISMDMWDLEHGNYAYADPPKKL